MNRTIAALALGAATAVLAGCSGNISEPWVSGEQAQALEDERTRTTELNRELTHRLQRYATPYR